jgi:hypothetical protein
LDWFGVVCLGFGLECLHFVYKSGMMNAWHKRHCSREGKMKVKYEIVKFNPHTGVTKVVKAFSTPAAAHAFSNAMNKQYETIFAMEFSVQSKLVK